MPVHILQGCGRQADDVSNAPRWPSPQCPCSVRLLAGKRWRDVSCTLQRGWCWHLIPPQSVRVVAEDL